MARRSEAQEPRSWPRDFESALAWSDGLLQRLRDDPVAAHREAEAFVRTARRAASPRMLAVALRARGHGRRVLRRISAALSDYAAARALFRRERLPHEAARTALGMVEALSIAGRLREAMALARSARAQFLRSGERMRVARLEINLGALSQRAGRARAALARYDAAERAFAAIGTETDLAVARFNRANMLVELDRALEAVPLYRASASHWSASGGGASLAQCRLALADALFRIGRPGDALVELEEAAAESDRLGDRALAATAALNRARIEGWLNRPDRVVAVLGPWIHEFERLALSVDEVEARVRFALALVRLRRDPEGIEQLDAAARRCDALGQGSRRSWVRYHRALADRVLGRYRECRAGLARCVREFERAGMHGLAAEARLLLASVEVDPGSLRVARALEATRPEAARSGNPWLAERWSRLNALHLAVRGSRARVTRAFEEAQRRLERLRRSLPEDALRAFLLADKDDLYDAAVALPALRPKLFPREAAARWTWRWTELAHAPRVRDTNPSRRALTVDGEPEASAREVDGGDEWAARLARERARLARLDDGDLGRWSGDRGRPRGAVSAERRRVIARVERLQRRLELAHGRLPGAPPREPTVSRLQRAIGRDEILLEYHVGARDLWVVHATRGDLAVRRLPGHPDDTRALVHRLRRLWDRWSLWSSHDEAVRSLRGTETHLLAELHQRLLAPVLGDATFADVAIVPHRWLRSVPFHALLGAHGPLVDRTTVRYGFSAAHALIPPAPADPGGRAGPPLIVGVSSDAAPRAESEARVIGAMWPEATILTGASATAPAVRERWPHARMVHLAAHGARHPDDPWSGGLLLHGGRFGVYDSDAIHSRTELVVLSACQTGDAVIWGSDDVFGLLPGLVRSGARAVVASLWTVGDAATYRWMIALHAHLARGARAEEAVRLAYQAARLADASAFHWAPFALYGTKGTRG